MTISKMTSVAVTGATRLAIAWDDGHVASIGLADIIAAQAPLEPLRDRAEFGRAELSADGWSLEWPSGIYFGAPQLRRWADEQAGVLKA